MSFYAANDANTNRDSGIRARKNVRLSNLLIHPVELLRAARRRPTNWSLDYFRRACAEPVEFETDRER